VSRVSEILKNNSATFQAVVRQAEGAYPTDVRAALHTLADQNLVSKGSGDVWSLHSGPSPLSAAEKNETHICSDSSDLPEPHPLDFDWRFARQTLELLHQKLNTMDCSNAGILGAPTLFKFLRDHSKTAHLFDRNTQIVNYLSREGYADVTCCDLFRFSARHQFHCVVADPPWYLDYYRAFIEAARRALRPQGRLLLSVLPRLTRPSADQDRSEILRFASDRGFDLVDKEPASLRYLSPPFETEALKSEGLNIGAWRSGDLYTFALSERDVPEYRVDKSEEDQLWHTWTVGRTVVKVKWDGSHGEEKFDLHNLAGATGIRFRSVSRRSPLRSRINVWTSRNIALRTSRPDVVCAALQLLSEGHRSQDITIALLKAEKLQAVDVEQLEHFLDTLINESAN